MFGIARSPSSWQDSRPIRSELFGIDRLEEHARSLASVQPVAASSVRGPGLSDRLAENSAFLLNASDSLAPGGDDRQELTSAAEHNRCRGAVHPNTDRCGLVEVR